MTRWRAKIGHPRLARESARAVAKDEQCYRRQEKFAWLLTLSEAEAAGLTSATGGVIASTAREPKEAMAQEAKASTGIIVAMVLAEMTHERNIRAIAKGRARTIEEAIAVVVRLLRRRQALAYAAGHVRMEAIIVSDNTTAEAAPEEETEAAAVGSICDLLTMSVPRNL